jgi:hypothetical protein
VSYSLLTRERQTALAEMGVEERLRARRESEALGRRFSCSNSFLWGLQALLREAGVDEGIVERFAWEGEDPSAEDAAAAARALAEHLAEDGDAVIAAWVEAQDGEEPLPIETLYTRERVERFCAFLERAAAEGGVSVS